MPKWNVRTLASAVVFAGATGSWIPFHSSTYPYTLEQPASFRHVILANTANQKVDFFFPSLGSFTTNVNILAQPGRPLSDEKTLLQAMNGHDVHRSGWLTIMGHRLPVIHADFDSLAGKYSIEQIRYTDGTTSWQLTASYEPKYRSLRSTMLKMIGTFQTDS
jgi:hypothetical protein